MKRAVEFAKEIMRKEKALKVTKSDKLKQDYQKSVIRDRKELCYYCHTKNISINEVFKAAR
jgi:membrane-bound inhibitor of C-type lysozyme